MTELAPCTCFFQRVIFFFSSKAYINNVNNNVTIESIVAVLLDTKDFLMLSLGDAVRGTRTGVINMVITGAGFYNPSSKLLINGIHI